MFDFSRSEYLHTTNFYLTVLLFIDIMYGKIMHKMKKTQRIKSKNLLK